MNSFEKITNCISLAKESNVPFYFAGNPGYGKTSVVEAWAEANGYHTEEIMGAAFPREEVLGYMVNVNGKLEMLEPFWFRRIKEKAAEGKKTVLFIDELPTAGTDVQSSLLRLIFGRAIGNGEKLPDDTIIISAGNYKANLPGWCDIMSPSLNRFCVVNVEEDSLEQIVDDYVINEMPTPNLPNFGHITNDKAVRVMIGDTMKKLFIKYSNTANSEDSNPLNLKNHNLQVYDAENETNTKALANFISGRSCHYLMKVLVCIAKSNIKEIEPLVREAVQGLIGAGTCTFQSEEIQDAYIRFGTDEFVKTIKEIKNHYVSFDAKPEYETITTKMVESAKSNAPSDVNTLFENVRRNVEHNPEEKEQIAKDVEAIAVALKVRGRNFEKKYKDPMFAAFCVYMTSVYADFAKKYKLDMDTVKYIKWYTKRMNENNVAAA